MPGIDSLKHAVAKGLGVGIVPRVVVASGVTGAGLLAVPLAAARGTRALTLVYCGSEGPATAAGHFVEALRSMGDDTSARRTPACMRASR